VAENQEEVARQVEDIMARTNGALDWSKAMNCKFSIAKTVFMLLTRKHEPNPFGQPKTRLVTRPSISIDGTTIRPAKSTCFLGLIINQELWFQ
jgi:hypothetical protein